MIGMTAASALATPSAAPPAIPKNVLRSIWLDDQEPHNQTSIQLRRLQALAPHASHWPLQRAVPLPDQHYVAAVIRQDDLVPLHLVIDLQGCREHRHVGFAGVELHRDRARVVL